MPMFRTSLSRLALAFAPLLIAGCAATSVPLAPAAPDLFDDAHFAPASQPIDPAEVFRLTPEMQAYVKDVIEPMSRVKGVRQALMDALYNRSKLQLEYDSSTTRTAAQAFDSRQGNCLSLVIMTGAFANALDLNVTYQQVTTEDMWSRSGGMYFMSGHVNLLLERRYANGASARFDQNAIFRIDFMPTAGTEMHSHPISQATVLAMFMNNRAAEAMVNGKIDDAYWLARQATQLDPQFLSAYNTLGVIYMRHGDAARAERVLHYALGGSPDNPRLLANYVEALQSLGRTAEAKATQTHLTAVEPTPPFYWFVQGQVALHRGDYETARRLFEKELARAPDYHEFHYALAVADFGLNRIDEARRELALAEENAVQRTDQDLYAAKLDKLKAWHPAKVATPTSLMQ